MRINKFIAQNTEHSRRKADELVQQGKVHINNAVAINGDDVKSSDVVTVNGVEIKRNTVKTDVFLFNKPVGYVSSRDGQGNPSVYDLIPAKYQSYQIAGRLDKDSSGLLIFTNDGELLNQLTHPSFNKLKVYGVTLDRALTGDDISRIKHGVDIGDSRPSKMQIKHIKDLLYEVKLTEGRNRQIRRTFAALEYKVVELHRISIAGHFLRPCG